MPSAETAQPKDRLRFLRWVINGIWILVLSALIIVALYVGLGRQLVGLVSDYRSDLEAFLSETLEQPVSIGALQGDWQGLDPVIVIRDVAVGDRTEGEPQASLRSLRIRLDTVVSLRRWRLVFREFTARTARATLVQQPSGAMGIRGLWMPGDSGASEETLAVNEPSLEGLFGDWMERLGHLLSDPAVQVVDLRVDLEHADGQVQSYQIPRMFFAFRQGQFLASGRLMRADANQQLAQISLRGRHLFSTGFDGQVYAEVTSPRLLDTVVAPYQWASVGIAGVDLNARSWVTFEGGRPVSAVGELSIPHLTLKAGDKPLLPIEDISARMGWRQSEKDGWQFNASDLTYQWEGDRIEPSAFSVVQEGRTFRVQGTRLEVGPLATFMEALGLLPDEALDSLRDYRPRGRLSPLLIEVGADEAFRLSGNLRDVSVQAFDGAPGVRGLDGYIEMVGGEGYVRFDARDIELGFPKVFVAPWQFDRLMGEVGWRRVGEGWQVRAEDLRGLLDQHTRLSGAFDLYTGDAVEDWLALRVGTQNATAEQLPGFLPKYEMDTGLYDWLVKAIEQADIGYGWYFGYGGVDDFYPQTPFSSSLYYEFSDARVTYNEQWPAITGAKGSVSLFNAYTDIRLSAGETGGLALQNTRVKVVKDQGDARVDLTARSTFDGETLDYWLRETPLAGEHRDAVSDLTFEGQVEGLLNLSLFPAADRPTRIDTRVETAGGRLVYQPADLVWDALSGAVSYSSKTGLSSSGLTARFLDSPVSLEVSGGARSRVLTVNQSGILELERLFERVDQNRPDFLAGDLDYRARLGFSPEVTLQIQSDTRGVIVDLPQPLGKGAGKVVPLLVTLDWPQPERMRARGHWADRLAIWAEWKGEAFDRAQVLLGASKLSRPQESGIGVGGKVEQLNVAEWQTAMSTAEAPVDSSASTRWLNHVDLTIEELVLLGESLGRTRLRAKPDQQGWHFELEGDRIAGLIDVPPKGPLNVDLKRLYLKDENQRPRGPVEPANAAEWAALDCRIQDFRMGETGYGAIGFQLRPSAEKLLVRQMEASNGSLSFNGRMAWDLEENRTVLNGELVGGTIADLEQWLGLGVPLTSETTHAGIDLHWPGGPQSFELNRAQGVLRLKLESGRIINQNNVAQLFRVFGVLNTDTLLRRLRLDFSDLYESGVSFDRLEAKAQLDDGLLRLDPELEIEGPSGNFRLSGSTNLVEETFDMRMVVALPLSQNLPLAALLFGAAPPVGGALFLVDRVMGDSLSRLTAATYTVKGTWDDPDIDLRNVFDTRSDQDGQQRRRLPTEERP